MNKQEFDEIMSNCLKIKEGVICSPDEEFEAAEATYMACGENVDKYVFCDYWADVHTKYMNISENIGNMLVQLQNESKFYQRQLESVQKSAEHALKLVAYELIDMAEKESDYQLKSSLERMAIQRVSLREYLMYKLKNGYELDGADKGSLFQILSGDEK